MARSRDNPLTPEPPPGQELVPGYHGDREPARDDRLVPVVGPTEATEPPIGPETTDGQCTG